jgi:G3E family GTPase
MPAVHCRIDPDAVWGVGWEAATEPDSILGAYLSRGTHEFGNGDGNGDGNDLVHADEAGYVAFAFEDEGILDEARFREFIAALPFELFRVKGTVRFADRTDLINLVGGRGEWTEWDREPATRLAFVGWEVDRDTILRRLEACRAAG